ncbi:putative deoxyribonuclease tatdn3-A isoform X2 [Rhinatrema bivittatum]|uniref:putative deoxyribonuclease tatdn3-A isoform X2 n=1 Tax=Rhinatrema bivittatum TaxID=194408 RepID=UPI001127E0C2|nr:putative deoxyribonuclease tatdn3-A isoform X2 [Rhinatrema bivittatum]
MKLMPSLPAMGQEPNARLPKYIQDLFVNWCVVGYVCRCKNLCIKDVDAIIEKSRQAGVKALVSVTEHANEFERLIHLSERYADFVMPCFGIHPVQSTEQGHHSVSLQIGLDFTPWLASTWQEREEQKRVFRMQLDAAKRFGLPVNVHSRSAGRQTISFLKEQGVQNVLLHNFAGRLSAALEGVQAGYFFSFPPAVARNDQRVKLIQHIPLENICLETDSPSLGPNLQERNVPENIRISCQYIASVKGLSPQTVCDVTANNALRLFPRVSQKLKE